MSIRLDWEIESDRAQIQNSGEDPVTRRQRRTARLRLLVFVLGILLLIGAVFGLIAYRLETVEAEIQEALRNTIDAEIAALRLGDWSAFSAAQRSASREWLQAQELLFNDYQHLKMEHKVQLTGRILDLTVDDLRGRAKVEEIIDGVPYSRVWFYWRYDDGWRHVPPDYTFWGAVSRIEKAGLAVRYQAVDAAMGESLAARLDEWLRDGCAVLTCGSLPTLNVEIVPEVGLEVSWAQADPWLLQILSPLVGRARSDMPFDLDLQLKVGHLLAERLVATASNNFQPWYPNDASYFRQAVVSWLVGRFVKVDTGAFLLNSLAQNYDAAAIGRLLRALQPDSSLQLLTQITGVPSVEQANLDWRDYLTWRLVTADDLLAKRDEANYLSFWDTRDENARNQAYQLFTAQVVGDVKKAVISAPVERTPDGTAEIRAVVQMGEGEAATTEVVLFRFVNGAWRRVN